MQFSRIRQAVLAGVEIEVGEAGTLLYAKGLMKQLGPDEHWILLHPQGEGKYQFTLPGRHKPVTAELKFPPT
ncbi:MAG: hypothetical protein RLZZ70_125 [Candidatus Parcubacteria bacterium]|jgi:hypothetical protein